VNCYKQEAPVMSTVGHLFTLCALWRSLFLPGAGSGAQWIGCVCVRAACERPLYSSSGSPLLSPSRLTTKCFCKVHTYIRTRTYKHPFIHTYIHTYIHAYIHPSWCFETRLFAAFNIQINNFQFLRYFLTERLNMAQL
jgi:hypothetical protein